jgi:hypothetical protein
MYRGRDPSVVLNGSASEYAQLRGGGRGGIVHCHNQHFHHIAQLGGVLIA